MRGPATTTTTDRAQTGEQTLQISCANGFVFGFGFSFSCCFIFAAVCSLVSRFASCLASMANAQFHVAYTYCVCVACYIVACSVIVATIDSGHRLICGNSCPNMFPLPRLLPHSSLNAKNALKSLIDATAQTEPKQVPQIPVKFCAYFSCG